MNRAFLTFAAVAMLAACDKPTEAPVTETSAPIPTMEAAEPVAETAPTEEAKPKAGMPDDLKTGEQAFYGSKFTVIEEPITLASAIAAPSDKPVKIEATVQSVCKKKGCWFTMSGEGVDEEVRVKMKDYAFFVPKNSEKAQVVAEGILVSREVPQEEAQHYADDAAEAGATPEKIDGPQKTWEFTATAIELRAAEG